MKDILVSRKNIIEYIPQKFPMVMLDTIKYCEGATTITGLEIRDDTIFVKDGVMEEPGIIENIAQTAAAKAGYEVKKMGAEPMVGFIGAVKDLKIFDLPKVGEEIETTITVKMEVMGVTLIDGKTVCNGREIASCEMKIFIQKEEA